MASQAERRARREARRGAGAAPPRPPDRPTANGGGGGDGSARPEPHHERRRRRFNFVRESWEELQKVEWPNQNQVVQGTVVVLVACIIVGFYLWGADEVFRRLVQQVFLGE
jgi:preprotein translocase SecE subunit